MRVLSKWISSSVIIVWFASGAFGQLPPPVISGPLLGFITDSTGASIRPILGVLGASVIGDALTFDTDIRNAVVSPTQDYALAVRPDTTEPVLIRLGSQSVTMNPLNGVRSGVDLVTISPAGTAAGLFGYDSKIFQSVTGLTDVPAVVFEFDTSAIPGTIRGTAVSDDGTLALLNFMDGDNAALWLVTAAGSQWLVPAAQPSAQNFLAHRHDAVVGDDGAREVFALMNADQTVSRMPLVSFGDGFDAISAVAVSDDGQRVFVTSKTSTNVTIVDLTTTLPTTVSCSCQSTGLQRLKGTSVFRLNDASSDAPISLLDASSLQPRIVIVPGSNND
jgi:hypothetical protein